MGRGQLGTVAREFRRIFGEGTVAGLSEWQLLRLYLERRDEDAFRAIVTKHGPMVLAVCRRVLGNSLDVEDAFQVTFLVLAKQAEKLGEHDPVGHWLYGVAYKVALRARTASSRRRARERVGPAPEPSIQDDPSGRELGTVIDEELARLPSKYRAPIVLCTIEGLTHEEAARQLGWPVGTVKGRLARARDLLKARLSRRGIAPSLAVSLDGILHQAGAIVSVSLAERTTRAAIEFATSRAAGMVSASAAVLLEGWMSTMILNKLKVAIVLFLLLGSGLLAFAFQGAKKPVDPSSEKPGQSSKVAQVNPPSSVSDHTDWVAGWPSITSPVDDSPKSRAILKKLSEPISMNFPTETPIEDVKKYIEQSTQDEAAGLPTGIPIYVDPQALQDADKTMASTVSISLEGQPLKTTLGLVLKQLSLTYRVKDGLLLIEFSGPNSPGAPIEIMKEKAMRGELTREQYHQLIEVLKLRDEVEKLAKPTLKPMNPAVTKPAG